MWRASLRSMLPYRGLIDICAPAGLRRHDQVPILDTRRLRDEIVLPGHIVDVDLHDAEVRDRRAEMGAHQRRHVAVEVVRRAVHLIGLSHGGDLHRLENAVPGQIDDADIHRIALEEVLELATAKEGFAARERRGNRAADQRERSWIEAVYLDPHEAMLSLLERANEADVTLGLEVEVEVEQKLDLPAGTVAKGCELLVECFLNAY